MHEIINFASSLHCTFAVLNLTKFNHQVQAMDPQKVTTLNFASVLCERWLLWCFIMMRILTLVKSWLEIVMINYRWERWKLNWMRTITKCTKEPPLVSNSLITSSGWLALISNDMILVKLMGRIFGSPYGFGTCIKIMWSFRSPKWRRLCTSPFNCYIPRLWLSTNNAGKLICISTWIKYAFLFISIRAIPP